MNEEKDLSPSNVDNLTKAQINEICADLLAKAAAHLAEAEKARSYCKEYGLEDPESAGRALERLMDETEAVQKHTEYVRELRERWASKHPGQTL